MPLSQARALILLCALRVGRTVLSNLLKIQTVDDAELIADVQAQTVEAVATATPAWMQSLLGSVSQWLAALPAVRCHPICVCVCGRMSGELTGTVGMCGYRRSHR